MSEILTNALKYAFPATFSCTNVRGEPCTIAIAMHQEGNEYILTISDNGIGLPAGMDIAKSPTVGLYLIRLIVEHQLRGSLAISTTEGTAYTIRFPVPVNTGRKTND
jgi:two-component sensor histidine kinase